MNPNGLILAALLHTFSGGDKDRALELFAALSETEISSDWRVEWDKIVAVS